MNDRDREDAAWFLYLLWALIGFSLVMALAALVLKAFGVTP